MISLSFARIHSLSLIIIKRRHYVKHFYKKMRTAENCGEKVHRVRHTLIDRCGVRQEKEKEAKKDEEPLRFFAFYITAY